ncbi:MAG: NlpC/P60 family protein, partial [Bacillota bacterium]|nr:NlpC/P60 family protein [Bacillota bacterium]
GLKNYKKLLAVALAVVLAIALVVVLNVTKPYAVYADGTKVEDPYVVKAGDEELFLVEDAETAEKIVEEVMAEYTPDGAQVNSITVDQKISIESKSLKRGEEPPTVLTKDEAVAKVLEENSTEEPIFCVTINAELGSVQEVAAATTYEETADLYEGQTKVKTEGTSGDQIVTNEVISVNGAVIASETVDTTILTEATESVVYKGTKEKPKDTVRADYSGQVLGSGSGASIASFAVQFVGNPYKAGGTSLTNGADCSGFTQSVFAKFGISLPRTSGGQGSVGKGVPYSEAKAGDIIYYYGHVGIYIGGGKIVHAATPSKGIVVSSVSSVGKVVSVRRIVE